MCSGLMNLNIPWIDRVWVRKKDWFFHRGNIEEKIEGKKEVRMEKNHPEAVIIILPLYSIYSISQLSILLVYLVYWLGDERLSSSSLQYQMDNQGSEWSFSSTIIVQLFPIFFFMSFTWESADFSLIKVLPNMNSAVTQAAAHQSVRIIKRSKRISYRLHMWNWLHRITVQVHDRIESPQYLSYSQFIQTSK